MPRLDFMTGNNDKLQAAQAICGTYGVEVLGVNYEVDEIQGEQAGPIVRNKAQRAYEAHGEPVVVSDDTWHIPALHGFPGPYMKSVAGWLGPDDILRLMSGYQDRTIELHQYLAYHDGDTVRLFHKILPGRILASPQGENEETPLLSVIAMDMDHGASLAETFALADHAAYARYERQENAWHDLAAWVRDGTR